MFRVHFQTERQFHSCTKMLMLREKNQMSVGTSPCPVKKHTEKPAHVQHAMYFNVPNLSILVFRHCAQDV